MYLYIYNLYTVATHIFSVMYSIHLMMADRPKHVVKWKDNCTQENIWSLWRLSECFIYAFHYNKCFCQQRSWTSTVPLRGVFFLQIFLQNEVCNFIYALLFDNITVPSEIRHRMLYLVMFVNYDWKESSVSYWVEITSSSCRKHHGGQFMCLWRHIL
jgi:hypothetical protein